MREYYEAEQRYHARLDQAAKRYVDGVRQAGLQSNETLMRAVAERVCDDAMAAYRQDLEAIHEHNIDHILADHHRRMNETGRDGAKLRMWTCPLAILMFSLVAWYHLSQGSIMGLFYVFAALVFLAMLVGGAIFDRER